MVTPHNTPLAGSDVVSASQKAGAPAFSEQLATILGDCRSEQRLPAISVYTHEKIRVAGARAKLFDVDHTLLRDTLNTVHDGYLGRHARAATAIVLAQWGSLPAETQKLVSHALNVNNGVLFSELEWNAKYRVPFTGISEEVTCLGIASQLPKDFPGVRVSMNRFREETGGILHDQKQTFICQTGPTRGSQNLMRQMVEHRTPGAVITGSPELFVRSALDLHGLSMAMSSGCNLFEATKKSATPVLRCVDMLRAHLRTDIAPSDCIMIGDQPTDALAPFLAGVKQVILIPDTDNFEAGALALVRKVLGFAAEGAFNHNPGISLTIARSLEQIELAVEPTPRRGVSVVATVDDKRPSDLMQ